MTEVCFENNNKVFVEKGKISERCFEPRKVKETVVKQREVALERNKINRCEALVWSVISYSVLPGLLLFQNMALLWVMGTMALLWVMDVPHVTGHLNLVSWIECLWNVTLDFLRSQSPGKRASCREVLSGTSESLLAGDWIKGNYLPFSMICFCFGRVRVW